MNCEKCGSNIGENDMFCPSCGTAVKKDNQNINEKNNDGNSFTYERPVNNQMNYNQPNYNQQQQPNQPNYGQPYQKNKNSGDIVKIVAGTVIGLAILTAIIFIFYSVISAKDKNKNVKNNSQVVSDNPSSSAQTSSSNNYTGSMTTVSNNKSSSYKVSYSGFKLYIPDELVYEMDYTNDAIAVGDASQTWIAELSIQQASFQQLKQNKSYLTTYFGEYFSGYNPKVSAPKVETIGGVEFVMVEAEVAGESMLLGYAELNSMYSMCFTLLNEDNDFNRDYLKNIAYIINTAEYTGDSSYMKANDNVKMKDIKGALQKAVEAQPNK